MTVVSTDNNANKTSVGQYILGSFTVYPVYCLVSYTFLNCGVFPCLLQSCSGDENKLIFRRPAPSPPICLSLILRSSQDIQLH